MMDTEILRELVDKLTSISDKLGIEEVDKGWEALFNSSNINIDLTEEEKIADFFLGLFPDIDDPEDLAEELTTYLEDLQVNAKARLKSIEKGQASSDLKEVVKEIQYPDRQLIEEVFMDIGNKLKQQTLYDKELVSSVVDFCDYFADNSLQLATDLINAKKHILEKLSKRIKESVAKNIQDAKKEVEKIPLTDVEAEQFETYRKFANEKGAFFASHTFTDQYEREREHIERRCDEVERLGEEIMRRCDDVERAARELEEQNEE